MPAYASPTRTRLAPLAAAALLATAAACADRPLAPPKPNDARPALATAAAAPDGQLVVVTVTAKDLAAPLIIDQPLGDDGAAGSVTAAAGLARTITLTMVDDDGKETHRAAVVRDLKDGVATRLVVDLKSPVGLPSRTVVLDVVGAAVPYTVTVEGASTLTLPVDDSVELKATVRDAKGYVVPGAEVVWGSSNPSVLRSDAAGHGITHAPGGAAVAASYRGFGSLLRTVQVFVRRDWDHLDAGIRHTCAVTPQGAAYCWGQNDAGQLGDGTIVDRSSPTRVAGGLVLRKLAAGIDHTCALDASGAAWCWGSNRFGQLGTGAAGNSTAPVAVAGGRTFIEIDAGKNHTCGLTANDELLCWGRNEYGQLGQGDTLPASTPTRVGGRAADVRSVSAGADYTCASVIVAPWVGQTCWGRNTHWQLGDSAVANPTVLAGPRFVYNGLTAGDGHTCALDRNAAVCWGRGGNGQLGDGNVPVNRSLPVYVTGRHSFATIAAGGRHTCAAEAGTGDVLCWGLNTSGELASGAIDNGSSLPLLAYWTLWGMSGRLRLQTLSLGDHHSCGLDSYGTAWCWGDGVNGQLGAGGFVGSAMAVRVRTPR